MMGMYLSHITCSSNSCVYSTLYTLQFAEYCEKIDLVMARDVFSRACSIHLSKKPSMHLAWAAFEERQGPSVAYIVVCNTLINAHC